MRRPRIARAPATPTRLPAPPSVSLPALPPAHRPRSPSAFFQGSGPARCSRLRAGHRSSSARALPPTRPRSNTHFASVTPPLAGQLRRRPSPTSSGRVVTPRPPTKHNTPPSPSRGEKRPIPLQPPSARVSPSQSHNLRAGRPGRGQPLPASKRGLPGSGCWARPARLPRARGRREGAPSRRLPSPHAPADGPRPACPPSPGRPWRPRRGASPPSARGAPRCSSPVPPHPLLAAPKGQETGVACLSWARLPRGSSGLLTRESTGTRRGSGRRDGPGAVAAGAPTAGPRRPGRWPCKPPLLGHAQVSAAPVPPAARVGRDPAPGESGRPPRRGARAVPSPRADPAAPGRGGRWRPGREDVFSRCAQLRARVSDGAAAAKPRQPCPRTGSRGSTAARRASRLGTSTEPGQRYLSNAMRAAQPRSGHFPSQSRALGPV